MTQGFTWCFAAWNLGQRERERGTFDDIDGAIYIIFKYVVRWLRRVHRHCYKFLCDLWIHIITCTIMNIVHGDN